ncbi:MAG: hypothetical protein JW874_02570, partial [Spirochaetales bacterium]|nr:hypothetical protein [Spirochaetales bacterium]
MYIQANHLHLVKKSRLMIHRPRMVPLTLTIIVLIFSITCCTPPVRPPAAWNALVNKNAAFTGKTGCWEGYNETGDPGRYYEFAANGLRLDYVHPEYYTQVNANGSLSAPGYQDPGHHGEASIDYPQLIDLCDGMNQYGIAICIGLFIHNFETVTENGLTTFLTSWAADLHSLGISSIIFVPAWEIQGQWAAWPQGATRDCYIDPEIFNAQMAVFRIAVDTANAMVPAGA